MQIRSRNGSCSHEPITKRVGESPVGCTSRLQQTSLPFQSPGCSDKYACPNSRRLPTSGNTLDITQPPPGRCHPQHPALRADGQANFRRRHSSMSCCYCDHPPFHCQRAAASFRSRPAARWLGSSLLARGAPAFARFCGCCCSAAVASPAPYKATPGAGEFAGASEERERSPAVAAACMWRRERSDVMRGRAWRRLLALACMYWCSG